MPLRSPIHEGFSKPPEPKEASNDKQSKDEQIKYEQSMDEQSEPIQWQIQSKNINDKNNSLNKVVDNQSNVPNL